MPAALLVPVQLQALLVNPNVRAQGFQRWGMDYAQLPVFGSPEPAPFAGLDPDWAGDAGNDGVHLQWTLPAGLRTGEHDPADRTTRYQLAPNRWLVLRSRLPAGPQPARVLGTRGWVVESDHLGPDGTSPYLDPRAATPTPTRIGRVRPLEGWSEPGGPAPFLTAVAPGNIAFCVYQPYHAGVFSLHDPADDVEAGEVLSYLVAGWYSDPAADVLAPARQAAGLAARAAELGWSAPAGAAADGTILHGTLRGLTYSRTAVGARPAATVLAVGNTSVDAVTALVRAQADRRPGSALRPELIEAFQYDLLQTLDEPDGPARLEARIHEAWFGARPGGSVWHVVAAAPDASGRAARPEAAGGGPVAAPDWLAKLNRAQSVYDVSVRRLAALQRELYELWWKRGRFGALASPPAGLTDAAFAAQLDPARPGSLAGRVAAMQEQADTARSMIPWGATAQELADAIDEYTRDHPLAPDTELKRADLPPFRAAADPVVVIAGAGSGTFRENAGAGADGLLAGRFADQTVSALTLHPISAGRRPAPGRPGSGAGPGAGAKRPTTVTVTSAQIAAAAGLAFGSGRPAGVPQPVAEAVTALQLEAYLLDPAFAGEVSRLAAEAVGDASTQASMVPEARMSMTQARGVTGTPPAVRPQPWTQPWTPLFLEWEVAYHPLPYGPGWTFDGTSYSWSGTGTGTGTGAGTTTGGGAPDEPIVLAGRSLLTPQPSATFKARLDTYLAACPVPQSQAAALTAFAESVDSWDLLSQTLSGFNEQLALRSPASLRAPDGASVVLPPNVTMADLVGGGAVAMPLPDGAAGAPGAARTGSGFQALRAGRFSFTRVSVVDRFGQSVDVVGPATAASFTPVLAEGLAPRTGGRPAPSSRSAQLPPRLLEPARLDIVFAPDHPAPAGGASRPPKSPPASADHAAGTQGAGRPAAGASASGPAPASAAPENPVCAWIVPSPLDEALACYAPDGAALGELTETAAPGGGSRISWLPAPGAAHATLESLARRFPVLGAFLQGLAAAGPDAFADLMRTVDATLWTIDPPGEGDETYLAALAGRPLALVRAALRGELARPPRTDPSWRHTFAPAASPVPGYAFPVRPGAAALRGDGLIGHLSEPDHARFRAAYRPEGLTSGYVEQAGPDNHPRIRFDAGEPTHLTLLMDPRLPVHLATGILPTATLHLPQRFVAEAMAAMNLTVRMGPLLTHLARPATADAPATVLLARPPQVDGTWAWTEAGRSAPAAAPGAIATFDIASADAAARFPGTPPTIRTGWLRLSAGPERPPEEARDA